MSYSEENGQVVLRIDPGVWGKLLLTLGISTGYAARDRNQERVNSVLQLINTLEDGNPDYKPYSVVGPEWSIDELADHLSSLLQQIRPKPH